MVERLGEVGAEADHTWPRVLKDSDSLWLIVKKEKNEGKRKLQRDMGTGHEMIWSALLSPPSRSAASFEALEMLVFCMNKGSCFPNILSKRNK